MRDFVFNTTPSIVCRFSGAAALAQVLAGNAALAAARKVLLVTDQGIMNLGLADAALSDLRAAGLETVVFDAVEADPKAETVLQAAELARAEDVGAVIGFGGGSSLDVAKLAALLAASSQPIEAIYGVNLATGPRLPLALVPTTAGTGSEVTAVAIVTTGTSEKKGVVSPLLLPDLALLDADLTLGLPPHITAATGLDAMVHAIEAFTSCGLNNNPLSKALARQALDLLAANIRKVVADGSDRSAREAMLLGSMLAGQAFANSPVGAVHALAYPIGSLFHVPHGLSNALVLEQVMRFNAPVCGVEYAELAAHIFPDIDRGRSSQAICAELIDRLAALGRDIGLGPGLSSVGITAADVGKLATDAMNQTRLLVNNPREVTFDDAVRIYSASL